MAVPTEVKVGTLVFEYDGKREMYVGHDEEIGGMIENVWPEDWAAFVAAVSPQCRFEAREDPPGSGNGVAWCLTHLCVHGRDGV